MIIAALRVIGFEIRPFFYFKYYCKIQNLKSKWVKRKEMDWAEVKLIWFDMAEMIL